MTDNEKRAHDLTISVVSSMMNPEFLKAKARFAEDKTVNFDAYAKYLECYKTVLPSFQRDFPDGN